MRAIRGAFEGAIGTGIITGIFSLATLEDADPAIAIIIGAILGAIIGVALTLLVMMRVSERLATYMFAGAVVGGLVFALAANYDVGLGDLVENSGSGVIGGGIIGLILARIIAAREVNLGDQPKPKKDDPFEE